MADLITRVRLDHSQFDRGISQVVSGLHSMERATQRTSATTDALMGGFPKMEQQATSSLKGIRAQLAGLDRALGGAGISVGRLGSAFVSPMGIAAAAVGVLTGAMVMSARAMTQNAEQVKTLMAVSGLGAEAADNLADTFELLGRNSDDVANAMFRMANEIDAGGQTLKLLGINVKTTSGQLKTEGALFLEVRDRISQMGTATERSAALMDLFGRAGRSLAPIFAMSRAEFQQWQEKAGGISQWSEEQQKATEQYGRNLKELGLRWDALKQQIGSAVIPIFNRWLETLTSIAAKLKEVSDIRMRGGAMRSGEVPPEPGSERVLPPGTMKGLDLLRNKQASPQPRPKTLQELREEQEFLKESDAAILAEMAKAQAKFADAFAHDFGPDMTIWADRIVDAFKRAGESEAAFADAFAHDFGPDATIWIDRQTDAFLRMAEAEKEMAKEFEPVDLAMTDLGKTVNQLRDDVEELDREWQAEASALGLLGQERERQIESLKRFKQAYKDLTPAQQTEIDRLAAARTGMMRVGQAQSLVEQGYDKMTASAIVAAQVAQDVAREHEDFVGFFAAAFQEAANRAGNFYGGLKQLATEAAQAMSRAMSDFFFNVFTGQVDNLKDVFRGLMNSMLRSISDFLASQLVKQFLGVFAGPGSGAVSSVASGAAGSVTGTALVTALGVLAPAAQIAGTAAGGPGGTALAIGGGTVTAGLSAKEFLANFRDQGVAGTVGQTANLAGVVGGLLSIYGGLQNDQNLMRAGNVLSTTSLIGTSQGAGIAALGLSGAATAGIGAGLAIGANIYSAIQNFDRGNTGAAVGGVAGTVVGGVAGTFLIPIPVVGTLIGAAIGGALGELVGGLFDDGETHEQRGGRKLGDSFDRLMAATLKGPTAFYEALIQQTTKTGSRSIGAKLGGSMFLRPGERGDLGIPITSMEMIDQLLANPEQLQLFTRGGSTKDSFKPMLTEARERILDIIEGFQVIDTELSKILTTLLKISTTPADLGGELLEEGRQFKEIVKVVGEEQQKLVDKARADFLTLDDPQKMLEKVAEIRALIEDRYQTEIELVRTFASELDRLSESWRGVNAQLKDQIAELRLSEFLGTNPMAALDLAQQRFQEAIATFRTAQTPEAAQRVSQFADPVLQAAAEVFARPSTEFQNIFQSVVRDLEDVQRVAGDIEQKFQDALIEVIGEGNTLASFTAQNTEKMAADIEGLRQDIRGAFGALGFKLPSFDTGIDRVPFDMVARLHAGETVLNAEEGSMFRAGGGSNVSVVFESGSIVVGESADARQTAKDIVDEIEDELAYRMRFGRLGEAAKVRVKGQR